MLNASILVLLSFSRFGGLYNSEVAPVTGHVFVVFVLTVAAAEAAVGLAIIISIFRHYESVITDDFSFLRW